MFAKSSFNTDVTYPGFDQLVTKEVEVCPVTTARDDSALHHLQEGGLKWMGSNSCILTGYGAYGISLNPAFSTRISLATRGVVFAIAHVRGGSEKGEAWYWAGGL